MARFDRIRYRRHDAKAFVHAFDLLELDGEDLRREPLMVRKSTLASLLSRTGPGLRLNEHLEHEEVWWCLTTRFEWALKALSRSARTRATPQVVHRTGSNRRTRARPQ
jgi:ATP-dependent DNA ligase